MRLLTISAALFLTGGMCLPAPARAADGPPGPPGMVWVDTTAAEFKVGTPSKALIALTKQRPDAEIQFMYEGPQYAVSIRPFFIGLHEVSNAQYLLFCDQTAKTTYKTGSSALSNLYEIGGFFVYGRPEGAAENKDEVTWGQLYELNKPTLWKAREDLTKDKDGKELPASVVKRAFRLASLPPDLELTVYKRRLPDDWFHDSATLEDPAPPDNPVRYVSYLDVLAFTKWAGFHVPTEEEWEVAARGPDLLNYPWGNDWKEGFDQETDKRIIEARCNWSETNLKNKLMEPAPMGVATLPDGRSWCGCFHMLGNVAEWTSSWFNPYPDFVEPKEDPKNPRGARRSYSHYYDDYVKVIRGGSCADKERIVLRLAARNFIGEGQAAPPVPENRFKFVGFRCAGYLQPGLDRYESSVLPLLKPKKLRRENLIVDRFAGGMATHWVPSGTEPENHVYVKGPSSAILFTPVKALFPAGERPPARTPTELEDESKAEDAIILGFFATDIPIAKSKVLDTKVDPAGPGGGPGGGLRLNQRKQKASLPKLMDGALPPDTYILGYHHGLLGLFKANMDVVGYLSAKPTLKVVKVAKDAKPPASWCDVDQDAELVKCGTWIPIGGKGVDPGEGIQFTWSFATEKGALDNAGSWRSTPAPK